MLRNDFIIPIEFQIKSNSLSPLAEQVEIIQTRETKREYIQEINTIRDIIHHYVRVYEIFQVDELFNLCCVLEPFLYL